MSTGAAGCHFIWAVKTEAWEYSLTVWNWFSELRKIQATTAFSVHLIFEATEAFFESSHDRRCSALPRCRCKSAVRRLYFASFRPLVVKYSWRISLLQRGLPVDDNRQRNVRRGLVLRDVDKEAAILAHVELSRLADFE